MTMKLAVVTILLTVLLIGTQSAPRTFDFGGLQGVIDGIQVVNGRESEADSASIAKAEEVLTSLIHKQLEKKRQRKIAERKQEVPEQIEPEGRALPENVGNINWEDHPESKAMINEKIPGGTEAVDALIKMIQEFQEAQK